MTFHARERVRETTSSTGTGDLTLGGVPDASYQAFAAAFSNGDTMDVAIFGGGQFELCRATFNSGPNSITRGTIYASSNGGAAVNFTAGAKAIVCTAPAALIEPLIEIANAKILGRKTAGSGKADQCTLSDVLDFIGSAASGDILYRGSSWQRLAKNNDGDVLRLSSGLPAWLASPIMTPQGRLTLTSGVAMLKSSVAGAGTIYYTPCTGQRVPIYNGDLWEIVDLGGELSQALSDTTKSPAAAIAWACYDMFVWKDGSTPRCTRGPAWSYAATVTMTIASPCVVTWTGHGLNEGDPIVFTTTGALPTGITAGTVYFVGRSPAANTFNISTTIANAAAGTFVNTSGSQSGAHTGTNNTRARGSGAGTTELELYQGRYVNNNDITNGPQARKGTFVGSILTNASATVDFIFGSIATGGGEAQLFVSNYYNKKQVTTFVGDDTNSWTYNTATTRSANGSVSNRITFLSCIDEDFFSAEYASVALIATVNMRAGVGFCRTTGFDGTTAFHAHTLNIAQRSQSASEAIGRAYFQACENGNGATGGTWLGDNNQPTLTQTGLWFSGLF